MEAGGEQRRLATGTLAIQAARIVAIVAILAVATALGRTLSLAEFGVYGLTLSISGYVLFIQGSVEAAALKAIAEARDAFERDRAFTTAAVLYLVLGIVAGALIALLGLALLGFFDIPGPLRSQARTGLALLALVTAVGWPLRTFQNVLFGSQRFKDAAAADVAGHGLYVAMMLVLVLATDAPLWLLIAAGGSHAAIAGATAGAVVAARRLGYRIRPATLSREYTRHFTVFGGYVLASAVTEVVMYSIDRAILAAFRSASTVGLYEAIVRPHALVRQLQGALASTVFPASARYFAEEDEDRVRQLLLRGTRYVLAVTVPVATAIAVLATPLLGAWLGERYEEAGTALAIYVGYWAFAANYGVAGAILYGAGRARTVAAISWATAAVNLTLSLALTSWLGLEGVVLGTTLAYLVLLPVFLRIVLDTLPVTLGELAHEAWLPAYSLALALAAGLGALRLLADPEGLGPVLAALAGGLAAYWALYWVLWLGPQERALARGLLRLRG